MTSAEQLAVTADWAAESVHNSYQKLNSSGGEWGREQTRALERAIERGFQAPFTESGLLAAKVRANFAVVTSPWIDASALDAGSWDDICRATASAETARADELLSGSIWDVEAILNSLHEKFGPSQGTDTVAETAQDVPGGTSGSVSGASGFKHPGHLWTGLGSLSLAAAASAAL